MNKRLITIFLSLVLIYLLSFSVLGCKKDADEAEEVVPGIIFSATVGENFDEVYVKKYTGEVTDVVIPETFNGKKVTGISDEAFHNATTLKSVTIPSSIKTIGNYAFAKCEGLTSITIPDSVTDIGYCAFSKCFNLASVTIGNGVTTIGAYAFENCSYLKSATIPNGVSTIGSYAFAYCDSLETFSIGNGVTSIGDGAFEDCVSLKFNTKDGLNYLGNEHNKYLYLVGAVDFSIKTANIESGCKFIAKSAFYYCNYLSSVTIPNGVTSIGAYAFESCLSLSSIVIPSSVIKIGNDAFRDCGDITLNCEVSSKPDGWDAKWAPSTATIVWK